MNNQLRKITLINKKTKKRRTIHLITKTKKKSFKFASINCKHWVKKFGFPIIIKVYYGFQENIKRKNDSLNSMDCNNEEDLEYALCAFVKEYLEERGDIYD